WEQANSLAPARTSDPHDRGLLIMLTALYQFHPDIYRTIEAHPNFYTKVLLPWAHGDKLDADYSMLTNLQRPDSPLKPVITAGATMTSSGTLPPSPTPEIQLVATYPDPSRGNVFRIQSLIGYLGEVTEQQIRALLLR